MPIEPSTAADEPVAALPTDRHTGCPFDPPADLTALREQPLRRLRYGDGHLGWLATGHAAVRAILADPRFSARYELQHMPVSWPGMPEELPPAPIGEFIGLDAPEHTRYRRLLAGKFTVRRMRRLAERVERFTAECLDAMEQLEALRSDPGLTERAVEELLRYLTVADPILRTALEDVEVEGRLITAGESVTVSVHAANRDPEMFPEPDRLNVHRRATGHLAFGHGAHQCLGQQLARVEMGVAFPALFARFRTLRLAVEPHEVPLREQANIYGVHALPVTWDAEEPPGGSAPRHRR